MKYKIREVCQEKGISQAELARRLGVSRQYISQLFSGTIGLSAKLLAKIAKALEVDVQELYSFNPPKTIGEKIKQLCYMQGLSRTELAQKSGVNQSNINRILNNKQDPRLKTLAKIAKALEVDVQELYSFNPPKTIGEKIKQLCYMQGLSQTELAQKSGITASNISLIICNKQTPRLQTLAKIAKALEVDVKELIDIL